MLSPERIEAFIEQVRSRAFDDAYIDPAEEQEIMNFAATQGLDPLDAKALLRQACSRHQFALESEVEGILTIVLEQFCVNNGVIDRQEFEDAVAIGCRVLQREAPRADINREAIEKMAIRIIVDQAYTIHRVLRKYIDQQHPKSLP